MKNITQYTFRIQNITPETMPFERILAYYQNLLTMLGDGSGIHLTEIFESSHASAFKIDPSCVKQVSNRVKELSSGNAPPAALKARTAIGEMLREDQTSASFEDERGNNVINFPSFLPDVSKPMRITDTGTFIGELYHISGAKSDARVRILTEEYGVVFCSTTKEIAIKIRNYLFEQIKVSGRGQWTLNPDTKLWDIGSFVITDFTPVKRESLRKVVENLRGLDIDWPEDTLVEIDKLNREHDAA